MSGAQDDGVKLNMETDTKRKLDAIAARAIHDHDMREILNDIGLYAQDATELRAAMDELPFPARERLFDMSDELEETTGRTNDVYQRLGDFAQERWTALMKQPNEDAKAVVADMDKALIAARSNTPDQYEMYRTRFAEHGQAMTETVANARNELRRDIRRAAKTMDMNLTTDTRAPLVEHLTRAAPVPSAVAEVMGAATKLEVAKAQADLAIEHRRNASPTASPKATYGM